MENHTWLVTDDGTVQPLQPMPSDGSVAAEPSLDRPYRLYRFLTDLEDILAATPNDIERLQAIAPLVRQLLISSYWLQLDYREPDPQTGWGINFLYREYEFPLTVQMVTWSPGSVSTIHNHGTWALVALLGGQERNRIWRRSPTAAYPDALAPTEDLILAAGDIITLTPGAIHQVEPVGNAPTISFNLYGVTDFKNRFEFDVAHQSARPF